MKLIEYQILASRTRPDLGDNYKNIMHMDMGIITEIGELMDIFKKELAYNKPVDTVNLGEELADICWYTVNKLSLGSMSAPLVPRLVCEGKIKVMDILFCFRTYMTLTDSKKEYYLLNVVYTIACSYGLDLGEILAANINKLKVRYPDKFDTDKALNRDLEAERKVLELLHGELNQKDYIHSESPKMGDIT